MGHECKTAKNLIYPTKSGYRILYISLCVILAINLINCSGNGRKIENMGKNTKSQNLSIEDSLVEPQKNAVIIGKIVLIGSMPFVQTALRGDDGITYELRGSLIHELKKNQLRKVELKGEITGEKGTRGGWIFIVKGFKLQ